MIHRHLKKLSLTPQALRRHRSGVAPPAGRGRRRHHGQQARSDTSPAGQGRLQGEEADLEVSCPTPQGTVRTLSVRRPPRECVVPTFFFDGYLADGGSSSGAGGATPTSPPSPPRCPPPPTRPGQTRQTKTALFPSTVPFTKSSVGRGEPTRGGAKRSLATTLSTGAPLPRSREPWHR